MLIKDFYKIIGFSFTENKIEAQVNLNPDHKVYQGHFPGQAVVPGVIQLQMIKELTEKAVGKQLFLQEMAFAKYLNMIVPESSTALKFEINCNLNDKKYSFSAVIKDEKMVFTKVKGIFSVTSD